MKFMGNPFTCKKSPPLLCLLLPNLGQHPQVQCRHLFLPVPSEEEPCLPFLKLQYLCLHQWSWAKQESKLGMTNYIPFTGVERSYLVSKKDELDLPYTVHPRMHSKEVTNLRAFPSDTAYKAFGKTSQVKAVHHMKSSNSTLKGS